MKWKNSTFEKKFRILMYVAIGITTVLLFFPFAYTYFTTIEIYAVNDIDIYGGVTDISEYDLASVRPFELNGEWLTYEGVYFDEEIADYSELEDATITELPVRDLSESSGTKTYQLYIKLELDDEELEDAVISIPFPTDSVRVYVNGIYIEGYYPLESWTVFDSESKVYSLVDGYDESLEYQVIMISINENSNTTDLYNREISISTVQNILGMNKMTFLIQGMLVAMMFFSILVGIIYIALLPTYSILTIMNFFDTLLMLHLFFNMSTLPQVVMDAVTLGTVGDVLFRSLDLFFFFIAGVFGNILSSLLFDKDGYYSKWLLYPINIAYVILAVILGLFPRNMNVYGVRIAVVLISISLVGIMIKFLRSLRLGRIDKYLWFHFIKTAWVGVVIFVDVICINSSNRPKLFLIISYTLFFLFHVVVRAVEYRAPYLKIAEAKENLEKVVDERTEELLEANNVLRRISIIDPLTKAYNRMYFEDEFRKAIESYNAPYNSLISLHICMFDLDNFKAINDTYGHQEGDKQLIEAVRLAGLCLKDDVIMSRIGGEEFTIQFNDYTDEFVLETVEKIRLLFEKNAESLGRTTGSFGIAKAHHGTTRKELLSNADKCLYHAKNHGKNQVIYNFEHEMVKYEYKFEEEEEALYDK